MARRWLSSKPLRERVITTLLDRGGLLAVTVAVVYLWIAPAHIVDGDNAEFATLAVTGGGAHPTGYPLYLLWLRATQWLPGANPAHVAACSTAVLAICGLLVLHAACRAWGARPFGATVAVAVLAGAPVVMRISTEAEVFALNNLVVAGVLLTSARRGPFRGGARVIALALIAGLGLSNHVTCSLLAPVGILGVARGVRETSWSPALTLLAAMGALLLGLAPYAYLLLTPETPMSWGRVEGLAGLFATITRADYGGPGAFLPSRHGHGPMPGAQLVALGFMLARTWLGIGVLAAVFVLASRVVRPRDDEEPRWGWAMLAASFLISGPALVTRFNLPPTDLGLYVCQRFYVMPAVLLAIPVAVACNRLRARERIATALMATIGFVAVAATSLDYVSRVHSPAVERYAYNLLAVLPQDSVVFLGQDDEYLGIGYLQWARGMRRDITVVAPQLTAHAWYRTRIARRGIEVPADGDPVPIVRLIDHLIVSGRPVFVEKARAEVISTRPTYPFATVMKVLPAGAHVPAIELIIEENEAVFDRFDLDYRRPGLQDELATAVHARYAATWSTLARKAGALGKPALAGRALAISLALGPRRDDEPARAD